MKLLMLALTCLLFVSCASNQPPQTGAFKGPFRGSYLSRITVGMLKPEVLRQIGDPHNVAGNNVAEIFTYRDNQKGSRQPDYYFVRFVEGKVESYGPQSLESPATASPAKP